MKIRSRVHAYMKRVAHCRSQEIVNDSFHEKVFKTVIRDNVALAEAPINGKTIFEYNPKSNGANDYMSLAKEVINLK